MQSLDDDERKKVLGEVLADELKVITEYVREIPNIKRELQAMNSRLTNIESDVKVIKAAVMKHPTVQFLNYLEERYCVYQRALSSSKCLAHH